MPVIKNTSGSKRNDKSQPPARGGGGDKGNQPKGSSLQSAAQRGQKDAPTTVKQGRVSGPTDYTHKSGGSKSAHSTVSYATVASTAAPSTASTSLSSAAGSWKIGSLGGIVYEEGNTTERKSDNALTPSPRGDQGGANPGDGDIVTNPIGREQTLLGETYNKRRDRSRSPLPATSSRPQHDQEIRIGRGETETPMRDGPVIKYQGSGSPRRRGTATDDEDDDHSMNDRSDIQSFQGSLNNDDKASDQDKGTSKPTSRTLDQVRFHFVGNFQVDLTSWKKDILYYGGSLVFSIEETDVAVVPDHNNKSDIQRLKKKGISVVTLTDLHTVLNGDSVRRREYH